MDKDWEMWSSEWLKMSETVECIVEYEYTAEQNDELTLEVGDVLTNVIKAEGGWWKGTLNGTTGMFPDNFVKVRIFGVIIFGSTFTWDI